MISSCNTTKKVLEKLSFNSFAFVGHGTVSFRVAMDKLKKTRLFAVAKISNCTSQVGNLALNVFFLRNKAYFAPDVTFIKVRGL